MSEAPPNLERALKRLSAVEPPPVPANVETNVWRRIRCILSESFDWRPDFWPQWLTNPAFGMGLFSASAAIGVLRTTAMNDYRESVTVGAGPASSLSIFSDRAPGMIPIGD